MAGSLTVDAAGRTVTLAVRRSARARRILLRIDRNARKAELVLPPGASVAEGRAFAEKKALWLRNRLALLPETVPFAPGESVPVLGRDRLLVHAPEARAGVVLDGGRLIVSGRREFFDRRVQDWLRREARRRIAGLAHPKAARIGRSIARISVRDQRSRWGSCSAAGNLSFSWRLILAPAEVLDYVVAHEVAHLAEPNHSDRFWRLVDTLTDHAGHGRAWLRLHGPGLHAYGAAGAD
ncbi:MAG: M48 family metallopeptidase [Rhodospirillaceae bacterium]|nr:M48 family metallopeptidase [Rhodospirillaceae bacterium]